MYRSGGIRQHTLIRLSRANQLTKWVSQPGQTCIISRRALQLSASRPIASAPSRSLKYAKLPCHVAFASRTSSASYTAGHVDSPSGPHPSVIFSDNQPADLPERLSKLSAWTITDSRMGIARQFTFRTFSDAWRFMEKVAEQCKRKRHHPSWSNLYNEVSVEWTTHKPKGLSIKDVEMAEICNQIADEIGLKA